MGKLDFGGGNIAYAFCTDIYHSRAYNRSFCLDSGFFSDWRVAWLVTHYPPTLNNAVQQAARQAAVWRLHRRLGARPGRRHPLQLHV